MAKLINILLRKTDPDYPWGFSLGALPPALHSVQITWVDKGSLASEHLEPGDRVLEIEGIDTTMLSNAEVESMLTSPSNKLELLIMKKSKNTEKPTMRNQEGCELTKTVKTQDRISSTTEESGETKIHNEDFLEESKIITREGTLHREIMETTEYSEKELKPDTSFWTCPPSDLVKQERKNRIKEQNVACRNTSGSGYISESAIFKSLNNYRDELRKVDPREEKRQFWESCRKGDSIRRFKWGDSVKPNRGPSPAYKSDGSMESLYSKCESQAHPMPKMERSKSCEPMESVPSSNPFSESFPGEFQEHGGINSTNPFYKEFESLNKAHCDSSSDSKKFKLAEPDCNMFKANHEDANNAGHVNKGSNCKYAHQSTSSDYSKLYDEFRMSTEKHENVSSTVNETSLKQGKFETNHCQEACFDGPNLNDSLKCDYAYGATSTDFYNLNAGYKEASDQQEYVSSTTVTELMNQEKGSSANNLQKTVRFDENNERYSSEVTIDSLQKTQPMRLTKALGKEDFETKCKFFEKATSSPVLCANKNAKDLVEERLKEGTPSSPSASPSMSPSITRKTLSSSSGTNSFPEVPMDESHLHLLKKPSDFINQQFRCMPTLNRPSETMTTENQSQAVPTIKVSEHSEREKCYDEERYENLSNHYRNSKNTSGNQGMSQDQGVGFSNTPAYANMSEYIANSKSVGTEHNATNTYQNTSEHSSSSYSGNENMNNTEIKQLTGSEKKVIDNFSTRDYVSSNQSKMVSAIQKSSEASWDNNTVSFGSSRVSEKVSNQPMGGGFQWFSGGLDPIRVLHEQARSHRGGSLERDFYEKRTFKESSFEKVIRSSDSPYENVESASSREYQEVSGPTKNVMNRSRTPSGFYDNSNIDDFAKELRAKSPLDISSKTFEDIRNRLGSLLGATPVNISCERSKLLISRGGVDKVEEAFQKLALQEGIVENIAGANLRQSSQIGGNGGGGSPGTNSVDGPPPPPPILGHIPTQKLASEIPPMRKEPPAAIQNAMMKDKKPFTYTPGGLDLAEIRSPRMAKRISRNAHMEDSCTPQQQRPQPIGPPQPLPPSALAAMQPQIAIPVFPPGGGFPSHGLPTPPPPPPPTVLSAPSACVMEPDFPPPPPLPPATPGLISPLAGAVPPPPPPPPPGNLPTSPISNSLSQVETKPSQQNGLPNKGQPLAFLQDIQNRPQLRSVGPINQNRPPPDFVAEIPVHAPLKPINHPPRSSYDPKSNPNPIAVALKPSASKPSPTQNAAPPFIPQPMSPEPALTVYHQDVQQAPQPPPQMPPPPAPTPLTLVQNQIRSVAPPTPGSASPGPQSPMTSNINKGPAPWMTTRQTSKDAPPPWTGRPGLAEEVEPQPAQAPQATTVQQTQLSQQQSQSSSSQITRVIPIQIEGREPPAPSPTAKVQPPPFQPPYLGNAPQMYMTPQQQQYMQQQQQQFLQQQQQQFLQQQQQQQLIQQQQVNQLHQSPTNQSTFVQQAPSPQQLQAKTRIIPIQIEGTSDDNQQQRVQVQSPVGFAQRSNSTDSTDSPRRPLQTQTSWTGNPTQSRSFRVLQKITGSEDEPTGPFPAPPSETFLVNRVLPPQQAASPVGADNSKCWNPNTPPPMYPNPNYWYYPPQSPEEQQQFWEHYNAMCAYMAQMNAAAYRYSPYPMYPYPYLYPSDNEEYSGYSSSDEMTYYGQMFKKQAEMPQAAKQPHVSAEGTNIINPAPPSINRESSDSSVNSEVTEKGDSSDAVSETDTEVGEDETKMNSLQSIKSVPNINVYDDSDSQTEESEVSEEEDEETDGETEIPHQLSIIFEESEQSDVEGSKRISLHKEQSQSNDSCATLQSNEDDENDNSTDSTVTVRLPLQFKFSRSSNDEEVATVIVGNSEVESGRTTPVAPENLIITDIIREDSDPDITATICLKKFKKPLPETNSMSDSDKPKSITPSVDASYCNFDDHGSTSDSPVDFWRELSDKETDTSKLNHRARNETPSQTSEDDSKHDESDYHSSSTSIQTVKKGLSGSENLSGSETENHPNNDVKCHSPERQDSSDDEGGKDVNNKYRAEKGSAEHVIGSEEGSESSEYESDEEEEFGGNCETKAVNVEEAVSINIPAAKKEITQVSKIEKDEEEEEESEEEDETEESERSCSSSSEEDEEEEEQKHSPKTIAKKETPRQPSKLEKHKSQEESEEDDSGVTSDLSRHISETDTDPECGGELRKMTRYQRAATHSRLFKLLQDECKVDEGPEEEPIALSLRKERLSLPLQNQYSTEQDSLSSSSGINSPSSPTTTDKLVKELVKSLLSRKKGRHFRKLPLEKLHAAALRILQEDMDPYDTASTSDESNNILSPVASTSLNQTNDTIPNVGMANPELYGGNYYDYCNYYSTWGHQDPYGSSDVPDDYEIVPSKAFRILQENTQPERYSSPVPKIAIPVRCPRVCHPSLQDPNPPPETNANPIISESTSTSQET